MSNRTINLEEIKKKLVNPDLQEWDPIIDLSEIKIPIFPLEIFPNDIRNYIQSVSVSIQVAVDAVAMYFFSVLSTAVTNKFTIKPKADWEEYLNLFVLIVAGPSERKTPVYKELIKPLIKSLEEINKENLSKILNEKAQEKILKKEIQELENLKITELCDTDKEECQRKLTNLYLELEKFEQTKTKVIDLIASDITVEKMAEEMENNGGALAILSSEGSEFLGIINGRYSNNQNYDFVLKGYSNEPINVKRMGNNRNINIDTAVLTVGLFTQPKVIEELPSSVLSRGLMQRFIYCYPKSLAGYRVPESPTVNLVYKETYSRQLKKLLGFCLKGHKIELSFSKESQKQFNNIRLINEKIHLEENKSEAYKQWIGKFDGNLARIMGLLHIMDHLTNLNNMPTEIAVEVVERASILRNYIIANAELAFGILEDTHISNDTYYVLQKIKNKYGNCSEVPYQKLWQDVSGKLKKSKVLREILNSLEEMNYLKLDKDTSRGRKEMIYLHPDLTKQ